MATTLSTVDYGPTVDRTRNTAIDGEVSLRNVGKMFGDREVIRGLNLDIKAGEFVAVVGRSGCGKSTLLRLIAGLESASSGTVTVGGLPVRGGAAGTRLMFQDARLLPWKRVAANVTLGLPKARTTLATAHSALQEVGLDDRQEDWPTTLSGGQRQRVALARALAAQPKLLLLDEPLGALDALTRRGMQELIARLWAEQRFTAVLITHDPEEAIALADRVLLLDNGRVTLDLKVDLPRPRPRGTAAFAELAEQLLSAIVGGERDSLAA